MTSITAASSNNYLSPLQQLQAELQSEVNSGAIASSGVNLRAPGSTADPALTSGTWEIGLPHKPIALPTIQGSGR